jgi:DNA-binding GntR family transcriptional regulator
VSETAPTAVQRVYGHVKERVLTGELADGTMLSEGQIAAELGVSRTPVREAFVQLEIQGLLRLYPKRGALVVPVSREEIDAVIETRWVLERHGLERAMEARDDAVVAGMRAVILEQQRRLDAGDFTGFVDQDREFHRVAVAATQNAILVGLYDSIAERQRRMVRRYVGSGDDAATVTAEHVAITDALAAWEVTPTLELLRAHVQRTRAALLGI